MSLDVNKEFNRRMSLHGDKYHYDNKIRDGIGETFRVLGKFVGNWDVDLYVTNQRAIKDVWGSGDVIYLADLADDTPDLNRILETFKFARVIGARVQIQHPGSVVTRHNDDFSLKSKPEEKIVRFLVFLEDWESGQTMTFGNTVVDYWEKGQVIYSDYEKIPHSTSNASWKSRSILQLTGAVSAETVQLLAFNLGNISI